MSVRRWSLWLGPPIALMAVALVMSQFQPGAEAGGRVTPRPVGVCANEAPKLGGLQPAQGTWWRLVDRLDGNGALVGRTLVAGQPGATNLTLELGTESAASGPVGGMVVVTTDDGRFSEVRLVSASEGCSWLIHRAEDVVRSAILDTTGGAVLAHLVKRETRADLGTWRISGLNPDATLDRVLAPLPPQGNIGPIWATALSLDATGKTLAVQSCAEEGCVTRIVSVNGPNGVPRLLVGPGQGSIIGFAGQRLLTWAQCQGLPCPIVAWDSGTGALETVVQLAAGAAITGDGRTLVAVLDATGRAVRVDLDGMQSQRILGIVAGDLPLGSGFGAYAGFEVASDEVAIAAVGADPHAFSPARAALAP